MNEFTKSRRGIKEFKEQAISMDFNVSQYETFIDVNFRIHIAINLLKNYHLCFCVNQRIQQQSERLLKHSSLFQSQSV